MTPIKVFIKNSEEAKATYSDYRAAYDAFWHRDNLEARSSNVPFNSPLKESTFIKRIEAGKCIKIGNTWFIAAPSYKH